MREIKSFECVRDKGDLRWILEARRLLIIYQWILKCVNKIDRSENSSNFHISVLFVLPKKTVKREKKKPFISHAE